MILEKNKLKRVKSFIKQHKITIYDKFRPELAAVHVYNNRWSILNGRAAIFGNCSELDGRYRIDDFLNGIWTKIDDNLHYGKLVDKLIKDTGKYIHYVDSPNVKPLPLETVLYYYGHYFSLTFHALNPSLAFDGHYLQFTCPGDRMRFGLPKEPIIFDDGLLLMPCRTPEKTENYHYGSTVANPTV